MTMSSTSSPAHGNNNNTIRYSRILSADLGDESSEHDRGSPVSLGELADSIDDERQDPTTSCVETLATESTCSKPQELQRPPTTNIPQRGVH